MRERTVDTVFFEVITGKELKDPTQLFKDHEKDWSEEFAASNSYLSVAAGDRLMEALEKADQELKEISLFNKNNPGKTKAPNLYLLGLEPPMYVLWVLKSIKTADLEQSLLVLPSTHLERLLYYLIVSLRAGRGVELCSRVAVFMVKAHENQVGGQLAIFSQATSS